MDDPACDARRLHNTFRRFGIVNRLVSGWDALYRARVRPILLEAGPGARVLDLGCGGGDVLARLARLARADGIDAEWIGADPDERARRAQEERTGGGVRFRAADSTALLREGERFDLVVSNHVLHHLDDDALARFAADSRALSRGVVLHADLARSRLAHALYGVGVLPLAPGTFLWTDGLRSIRRSHTTDELASALGSPWRVSAPGRFRVLAEAHGAAGGVGAADA